MTTEFTSQHTLSLQVINQRDGVELMTDSRVARGRAGILPDVGRESGMEGRGYPLIWLPLTGGSVLVSPRVRLALDQPKKKKVRKREKKMRRRLVSWQGGADYHVIGI